MSDITAVVLDAQVFCPTHGWQAWWKSMREQRRTWRTRWRCRACNIQQTTAARLRRKEAA